MKLRGTVIIAAVAATVAAAMGVNAAFGLFCAPLGDGPFDYWRDCF